MIKRDGGIVYEKLVWYDEEISATQTDSPSSAVNDELKEIFKTIFGERDVWEVIDRKKVSLIRGENTTKNLTPTQKKMYLKLVCDGKYTEDDLIFIRAIEDFSSGFAFTKDAFCIGGDLFDYQLLSYRRPSSKFKNIPYEKITDIEFGGYSRDWAEKKVPTLKIKFRDDSFSNVGDVFFNVENVRNKYTTPIITERILWQIGKFLEFVKG